MNEWVLEQKVNINREIIRKIWYNINIYLYTYILTNKQTYKIIGNWLIQTHFKQVNAQTLNDQRKMNYFIYILNPRKYTKKVLG